MNQFTHWSVGPDWEEELTVWLWRGTADKFPECFAWIDDDGCFQAEGMVWPFGADQLGEAMAALHRAFVAREEQLTRDHAQAESGEES